MKSIASSLFAIFVFMLSSVMTEARADSEWVAIEDPEILRELISGRALDGKYWKFYFRADGAMGYSKNDFASVRGWSIKSDGRLCYSVYSLPNRIIDCHRIERTRDTPTQYRFRSETEEFLIEFSTPSEALVDAVIKRAGPE